MSEVPSIEELFETLRAEEEFWLDQVFVPPFSLDDLGGSIAILGSSGSGKTALRLSMQHWAFDRGFLPVDWLPTLPRTEDVYPVDALVRQAIGACLRSLIEQIVKNPLHLLKAPTWVHETITLLTHYCMPEIKSSRRRLGQLIEHANTDTKSLLERILTAPLDDADNIIIQPVELVRELIATSLKLNYRGIWLLIDDLDRLAFQSDERDYILRQLLSSLELFDTPGMTLKLFAPDDLYTTIATSRGVQRRRLLIKRLSWLERDLIVLATRRMALLFRRPEFTLNDFLPSEDLVPWLNQYTLPTPRAWLERLRPLVYIFQAKGGRVLDPVVLELAPKSIPSIGLDLTSAQAIVNGKVIQLQPQSYRLLRYLYQRRGRVCSRSELYYLALLDRTMEPRTSDDVGYEVPADWEATLNSALNRLRKVIEPNPKAPQLIITVRGQGVQLAIE